MKQLYVVSYTTKNENFVPSALTKTFHDEEQVLKFVMSFTDEYRQVSNIFSVDHQGSEVTHYNVVFEGRLKLIEKIK